MRRRLQPGRYTLKVSAIAPVGLASGIWPRAQPANVTVAFELLVRPLTHGEAYGRAHAHHLLVFN